GGRETPLVGRVVATKRADVIQRSCLATHDPVSAGEIRIDSVFAFVLEHGFVKSGRQRIDQIDIAGELAMLFLRYTPRNEDAQMADRFMDCVDNGLPIRADIVDAVVQIEDPSKRLLWRRDVVAF